MMHPGMALQEALFQHLAAQETLQLLLGGVAIFDDVPKGASPPYITFAEAAFFDWSTATEGGTEHVIALNAWSDHQGRLEVLQIAQAIEQAIYAASLSLQDHTLVSLNHESTEVSKEIRSDLFLARIQLRAITEPDPVSSQ